MAGSVMRWLTFRPSHARTTAMGVLHFAPTQRRPPGDRTGAMQRWTRGVPRGRETAAISSGASRAEVRVTHDNGEHLRDVVAGLLRHNDHVLLCHRHSERQWYPDVWDLPGGHVQPHEDPLEALHRELREELGINITAHDQPHDFEHKEASLRLRAWIIDEWVGNPANLAREEHDKIAWFSLGDSRSLPLAHPGYVAFIERALASP